MLMAYAYPKMGPAPTMPPGLVELMEDLTKEVIRNSPTDVYDFCAHHMKKLLEIRDGRPKSKPITLEQRIARAQTNIRKRIEERYFKLRDVHLELSDEQQKISAYQPETKCPIHQEKSLQDGEEIEILPKVISEIVERELINNHIKDDDEPKTCIIDTDATSKSDKAFKTIENFPHSDKIISSETVNTTINEMPENTEQNQDEDVFVKKRISDSLSKDNSKDLIEAKQDLHDFKKQIENFHEPLNAFFTETAITPTCKDVVNANLSKSMSADNSLHGSSHSLNEENYNNNELVNHKGTAEAANALEESNTNSEKEIGPIMVQDVNPEYHSEEGIAHGENINLTEVVNDDSNDLITQGEDLHVNISTESHPLETHSSKKVEENSKEKNCINLEYETKENLHKSDSPNTKPSEEDNQTDTDEEKKYETKENLHKSDSPNTKPSEEDNQTDTDEEKKYETKENLQKLDSPNSKPVEESIEKEKKSENKDSNSQENNSIIELNEDLKSKVIKSIVDNIGTSIIITNEDEKKNVPSKEIKTEDSQNSYIGKFNDHCDTKAIYKGSEITDSDNKSVEILPVLARATNINIKEEGDTENKINWAQSKDTSKDCELVASVKTNDGEFVKGNAEHEGKVFTKSGSIDMSANKDDYEMKEYDVTKDDKSDFDSSMSDSTHATMNLETAAITIQKVFRNFLFKSRASTFDDAASDESNNLEKEFKDGDFSTLHQPVKDRRPPGLGRMDTMLQTVNEEKSLSLSTDDSSTISSAATIIQAHVRGFLARNKWHSSKTTSSNSLQNSNPSNPVSTETQEPLNKIKTVLNIHIVPENGNFISRDDSVLASIDLSLDGSPPTSTNLHPHDVSERRKLLKREDAIQSISPPSNNSGKLSEDAESVKELPLHELNASNNLTINDKDDFGKSKDENTNALTTNSVHTVFNNTVTVVKDSSDEHTIIDNTDEKLDKDGDRLKKYDYSHSTDELSTSDHDNLENKYYNQSSETTPTSSITSDTVIEVKKDKNNTLDSNKTLSNDVALKNTNEQSFNNEGFNRDILIIDDTKEAIASVDDTEHDVIENITSNDHSKNTLTDNLSTVTVNKDRGNISNTSQSNQTNAGDILVPIKEKYNDLKENISHNDLSKVTSKITLTTGPENEDNSDIFEPSQSDQTNDAKDVIVPITEKKSEIPICSVEPKLLHSGEFHDIVLPTKVSRNETSVVRGE